MTTVLNLESFINETYNGKSLEKEYKEKVLGLKERYTYIKNISTFTHKSLYSNSIESRGSGIARVGFYNLRNGSETCHKISYTFRLDSQDKPRAYVNVLSLYKSLPVEAIKKLETKGLIGDSYYVPLYSLVMCLASDNLDSIKGLHCHHWMIDPWNNDIRTLEYLTPEEHRRIHSSKGTYLYDPEFHSFTFVKGVDDARNSIYSNINAHRAYGEKVLFLKVIEEQGVTKMYICTSTRVFIINPLDKKEVESLPLEIYNEIEFDLKKFYPVGSFIEY